MLLRGGGPAALTDLLATLAVLLAPAVVSFELARVWRREHAWLRFATAFNWCQWGQSPLVAALLMLVLGTGDPARRAERGGAGHHGAGAGLLTACGCIGSWCATVSASAGCAPFWQCWR